MLKYNKTIQYNTICLIQVIQFEITEIMTIEFMRITVKLFLFFIKKVPYSK